MDSMEISNLSRGILRELCTDSRTTITALSSRFDTSRPTISKRISSLERELGLRYILELNYKALGFSNMQILHLKLNKKPANAALIKIMNGSRLPQLAVTTKGDFDIVVFVIGSNAEERGGWEFELQLQLSKYGVLTNASNVDIMHLGFIPLSRQIIETAAIDDTYKRIILELNDNSRISIKELSDRLSMNGDMVHYYIKKLVKEGFIKRFTTVITKPPAKCNILLFATYTFSNGMVDRIIKKRNTVYFRREEELPISNEYQIVASTSGGEQDLVLGTYRNTAEALDLAVSTHKAIFSKDRPIIKYGIVENVIKGVLPIRSIDIRQNYQATEWSTPQAQPR